MSYRIVIPAVIALAAPLGAQTGQTAQKITFEDAIGLALKQNVTVRQAQNSAALNTAAVQQQKMAFLPSLSLNVSGANDVGSNFNSGVGAVTTSNTQSLSTGVSSSVTLFDGMKNVTLLKQAQLGETAGEQDLTRAKQTAVFTVASNYLALVTQQEQLRVQTENLAAQQALEAQIQKLVNAGTRPISDLYQQQATVAAARSALVEAKRALELAKVDIVQTLQLDASVSYDFVAPNVNLAAPAKTFALDSLVTRALAARSDLAAQGTRVDAASQGVKAAAASRWPTLQLSAGYNTGFSTANVLSFADQLDQRRGGSIGLGVSIPLFDKGATSLATQRAQIEEDNARLALAQQKQAVTVDVRRALLAYQASQERLAAATAQRQAAEQATTVTQQRYQLGAATLVELAQARASQVQAASSEVSARYDLVFQQALMSYYTGELDPTRVVLGS
jgi:outer membrane protein